MPFVVARSKLVPDFAATLHGVQLCVTMLWTGEVPGEGLWWAVWGVSGAGMVVGGVWGCRWRELRPIAFGGRKGGEEVEMEMEMGAVEEGRGGRREEVG